jgi:hypothetical protein
MINAFLKGGRYSKGDFRQYFSQSGIDTKKVMMGFKKYRDQPVNTILDLDYLEWAVDKTKNRYLKIAILERIT